jgi:N-glycosylase/DNA lyase
MGTIILTRRIGVEEHSARIIFSVKLVKYALGKQQ